MIFRKLGFGLVAIAARALPSKARVSCAEWFLNRSRRSTLDLMIPERRGWEFIVAALLRASLSESLCQVRQEEGVRFAVPQRITIGEGVMYYDYASLQAREYGWKFKALDFGVYPCTELIQFFFKKEEIEKIDDPIHRLLWRRIDERGEKKERVLVDLYVVNVAGKILGERRIRDIFRPYDRNKDSILKEVQEQEPELAKAYHDFVSGENCIEGTSDYCQLAERTPWVRENPRFVGYSRAKQESLFKRLELREPYVTLFLRPLSGDLTSPRSIHNVAAYRTGVEILRKRGYTVVLLGTEGSTLFPDVANLAEMGVLDYPRSGLQSLENDLFLVEGSAMMIVCTSGPSSFPILFRVPTLWLNTLLPAQSVMLSEHRFYPKTIRKKRGERLNEKEWLRSPCLYAQHQWHFDIADLEYEDLDDHQIGAAVEEFLDHVEDRNWKMRTEAQRHFLGQMKRWHLHLKTFSAAPCDHFIRGLQEVAEVMR